jgi:DNA primase
MRMIDATAVRRALTDPSRLCGALGLTKGSRRQARGLTVLCPFHREKSPSCSVRLGADGTIQVHCFGCDASGDALCLVAAVRGLDIKSDFSLVLDEAARIAGIYVQRRERDGRPAIDGRMYSSIMTRLCELCPWVDDHDAYGYVVRRVLVVGASDAGFGGLPPPGKQGQVVHPLAEEFGAEALVASGLVWLDRSTRRPDLDRFARPDHRLLIPWRRIDGSIAVLQRRRLDHHEPKYVFPSGMRPTLPFGAERLRAHGADRTLVLCEGALDTLALRLLDGRDGLGILPLGLPGLDGWRAEWATFARGREACVAFDADAAAERKAAAVAEDLWRAGATRVQRWRPKHGAKDWAELVERGAPRPRTRTTG